MTMITEICPSERKKMGKKYIQQHMPKGMPAWVCNALMSISQKETFPLPMNETEFKRWKWKMETLAEVRAENLKDLLTGEDDYSGHIQMQRYWQAVRSALTEMK